MLGVMAGLDPAIHEARQRAEPYVRWCRGTASWIAGSSPAKTNFEVCAGAAV